MKKALLGMAAIFLVMFSTATLAKEIRFDLGVRFEAEKELQGYYSTEIEDILNDMTEETGVVFQKGPEVEGLLTIPPREDITVEQALSLLFDGSQFAWVPVKPGEIYTIGVPVVDNPIFAGLWKTRTIRVDYPEPSDLPELLPAYREALKVSGNFITITALNDRMMKQIEDAIRQVTPRTEEVVINAVLVASSEKLDRLLRLTGMSSSGGGTLELGAFSIGFDSEEATELFRVSLEALHQKGVLDVVARPDIRVRERGEISEIKLTKMIPTIRYIGEEEGLYEVEYEEVGITLNVSVKNVIFEKDTWRIVVNLDMQVSEVEEWREIGEGRYPVIGTRKEYTEFSVLNNEVTVFGGLTSVVGRRRSGLLPLGVETRNEQTEMKLFLFAHVLGTEEPEEPAEETIDKLIEEFTTEIDLKRAAAEKSSYSLGLGSWFPFEDGDSLMVYEGQLRLKDSLRFVAGGGGKGERYITYYGLRYEIIRHDDFLNIVPNTSAIVNFGAGGIDTNEFSQTEPFLSAGVSLGNERMRLEGSYLYLPRTYDNGITVLLAVRF